MKKRQLPNFLWLMLFTLTTSIVSAQCLQTAPYYETFDSLVEPNCITSYEATGSGWVYSGVPGYASASAPDYTTNGGGFAWIDFSTPDDSTCMELPTVNISALTTPQLTFSLWSYNTDNTQYNDMFIEAFDGTNWVQVDSLNGDLGGWSSFSYDLTAFVNGGNVQIRFRGEASVGTAPYFNDLLIDDVAITEFTFCERPGPVDSLFVGTDSVYLNWNKVVSNPGDNFNLEYGAVGFARGAGTVVAVANDTNGSINNLSALTDYDIYLRTDCGAGSQSIYKGPFRLTTKPTCIAPTNGLFNFVTSDSVMFSWSTFNPTGNFDVEFGPVGFVQGTNSANLVVVNGDTLLGQPNLSSGTTYEFYVRENCGGGDLSAWAGPFTVSLPCPPVALPISEDFNSGIGCFTVTDGGTTSDTWYHTPAYGFASSTLDGTDFMFVDSDGAGFGGIVLEEILSSPITDATGLTGALILSFDQYFNNLNASDTAFVDVFDGTSWVNILTQNADIGGWSSPDQQRIDVSVYANANFQVRFRYEDNGSYAWYWAVDNFFLREVLCNESSNLNSFYTTTDTISINWTPGTGLSYIVEYGVSGFTPGTGSTIVVTDTFADIGSLAANTAYDFYVTDSCAGGFSSASNVYTASTLCNAIAVPFTETFNANSTTESCWTVLDNNGDGDVWRLDNTLNALSGESAAINTDFNFGNNDDWLISPGLSFTGNEQLTFYYRVRSAFEPNDFQVLVSTTGVAPADFTDTILPLASYSNTTYMSQTINMAAYTTDAYVAWHIPSGGLDGWELYIDSVVVDALPPCPDPSGLTATNILPFQADLGWSDPTGTAWNIEIVPAGFGQGSGTAIPVTNNPYTANTLMANTCYDYYVQQDCGPNGTSQWIGPFTFCTPPTCPAPTNLGIDPNNLTINSADVYFTPGLASDFNIQYGSVGFALGSGSRLQVTNDTVTLPNLMSGTEYEFYVRDSCSTTDTSTWSGPFSFITAFNTNYLEDVNSSGFALPFAWFASDALLTSSTVLTPGFSSWGTATFGSGASTTNSTNSFRANIYTNQTEWAISPSIYVDPAVTNMQVEFDASVVQWSSTNQGYLDADDSLAVVVSTDNGATDSDTINLVGEHFIIPLTGYSGYLRFGLYGKSVTGPADNDFYIDNFEVRTPRACNSPVLDSITGVTLTSATVHWTDGDVSASSWDIILASGGQPASAGMVTTVTTNGSYNFTTLTSATDYCVYLVETCANGISDTAGPICFSTPCTATTLPYTENFTNSLGCFTAINGGGTPDTWFWTADYNGLTLDGTGFAFVDDDAPGAAASLDNELMESVIIDASGASGPVILEYDHYYNNIGADSVAIDVYDGSSWVRVLGYGSDQGSWASPAHDSLDISAYANAAMQVRFRYHDGGAYAWYWAVDNVEIYESSACPAPSGLDTVSVDCDEVSVTWNSSAGASTILEWGTTGFALGAGTIVTGATAAHTISSLTPNTAYDFYVRDVCTTGDTSAWAGPYTFTTDTIPAITAAFTFVQSATTATNATVDFDASTSMGANNYAWDFGNGQIAGGMNATAIYDTNGTYTVCLAIVGDCGALDTICQTVVIQGINLDENKFNASLSLFPNPSKGSFVLNVGNTSKSFDIEVTDLRGRVIYRADNLRPREDHVINIDAEAAGMYMLSIKGEGLLMNRRIMIER